MGSLIPLPAESLDQPGAIGAFYPFAGKDEVKGYGRNNVGVKRDAGKRVSFADLFLVEVLGNDLSFLGVEILEASIF